MTLRSRIILVAVASLLLVAIAQIATSWMAQEVTEERFGEATINGKTVLWRKIVASQLEQMEGATTSLTRDRESLKAIQDGDLEALADSVITTFNRLSTSNVLTRLQVFDLKGKVLFSAPEEFSGKTGKSVVVAALSERKVQRGIVRDDDGKLIGAVAFPLYARGKPMGVGLYARDLQGAIDDFKANDNSENFIFGGEGAVEYVTDEAMLSGLDLQMPPLDESSLTVARLDGRTYAVVVQPIMGAAGKAIAHLASVNDLTASYSRQQRINLFSYLFAALIVGLAVACLYWYMNRLFKPLQTAVTVMNDIAAGDLTTKIESTSSGDEVGQLLAAMKAMAKKLRAMIGEITGATAQLASAAEEMSAITDTASSGVQRQQSETGQVATAINEMSATVQEVARNAASGAEAAREADEQAKEGRQVVAHTIDAIDALAGEVEKGAGAIQRLAADSESISAVLDVIRGISEQTNLLALNAAIEAARAGEKGRGFAVVADEVRTLASRTQQSTQEIHTMIERLQTGANEAVAVMEASRTRAQGSVEQAAAAGISLETITRAAATIADMNMQIASAAEEQTAVVEEINRSVVNISDIADQSADGTRQTAAASDELARLAVNLQGLVGQFKI